MKRPVILLFAASLFMSGAAFAKQSLSEKVAHEVAKKEHRDGGHHDRNDRAHDRRHDRRDDRRDHRRDDRRDHRRDDRRDDRRDHRRDDRRHDRPNYDGRHASPNRGWDRPRRDWDRHPNYWDNRRHDRRDYARHRYHYGVYHAPRGYYHRTWHRGDRLPRAWYGSSYVVYDWRPYRLYSPPRGYHWVRVGNDVILTAIATGIVLDVLYDIWY